MAKSYLLSTAKVPEYRACSRSLSRLLFFTVLAAILFSLTPQAYCAEVTLAWDPNSEPDVAGYKLYYKISSSGEPYDGTGATEGNSPIDVGNLTTYTLYGLAENVAYFFVVTAYDDEGRESDYSNEVSTDGPTSTPTASISAGVADGGGCFIATVN
jgi:hypothetical protein